LQSLHDTMKEILVLKKDRKQWRVWESDRVRRALRRQHLVDADSSLAILAAY
jgi:hypothetical protein